MKPQELLHALARTQEASSPALQEAIKALIGRFADQTDLEITASLLKKLLSDHAALTRELQIKQAQLQEDLRAAAEIQSALLPDAAYQSPRTTVGWRFIPCEEVGGDSLHFFSPQPGMLCLYVLDVCGHGVPAAMLSVSAAQAILRYSGMVSQDGAPPDVTPAALLNSLDREFPFERFESYFTMSFMVFDETSGFLRYANAGHPPPVLLRATGETDYLDAGGSIIGLGGFLPFEEGRLQLHPGDRVLLYTDGVTECADQGDALFGEEKLIELLQKHAGGPADVFLDTLIQRINTFCGQESFQDDVSVMVLDYTGKKNEEA